MSLTVHFLNVNRGDTSIVEFPSGRVGIIDLCDYGFLDEDSAVELAQESGVDYLTAMLMSQSIREGRARRVAAPTTNPLDYWRANFPHRSVFRLIVTHPHMDHIAGLDEFARTEDVQNLWYAAGENHELDKQDWAGSGFREVDWLRYKRLCSSSPPPRALYLVQDRQGEYWTEDGVEILSPTDEWVSSGVKSNDLNLASHVLRISYGGRTIVFGGDAPDAPVWETLLAEGRVEPCTVLKASHHGRRSGYHGPAVKRMAPWLAITSVGQKKHDATEAYRRYATYTVSLRFSGSFRLKIEADGRCTLDDHVWPHLAPKTT